jgi:ankyrin repeat protein
MKTTKEQLITKIRMAVETGLHEQLSSLLPQIAAHQLNLNDINTFYIKYKKTDIHDNLLSGVIRFRYKGAAKKNYAEVVKLLIEYGMDPNLANDEGMTPLHFAAERNVYFDDNTMISSDDETLLKTNALIDDVFGAGASAGASLNMRDPDRSNFHDVLDYLLQAGANFNIQNDDGHTPLHTAVNHGDEIGVTKLLEAGANLEIVSKQGFTPLYLSILRKQRQIGSNLEIMYALIAKGADIKTPKVFKIGEKSPLQWAQTCEAKEEFELLKKCGAHQVENISPLHYAAKNNDVDTLNKLLAYNFLVNAKDDNGGTSLHLAAFAGNIDIVQKLLSAQADVNAKTSKGLTAIHFAVNQNHVEIIELLLQNNADIHVISNAGKTLLHQAQTAEMKYKLLDLGVDPAFQNNQGELAVSEKFLEQYQASQIPHSEFTQNLQINCLTSFKYDNPLLNDQQLLNSIVQSGNFEALTAILNNEVPNIASAPINNDDNLPHTQTPSLSIVKNAVSYLLAQLLQPTLHYAKDVINGDNKDASISQYYADAYQGVISGKIVYKILTHQATQAIAATIGFSNINSMLVGKIAADVEFDKLVKLDFSSYTTPQYAQNTLKYLANHLLATSLNMYLLGNKELAIPQQVLAHSMPGIVELAECTLYQSGIMLADVVKANGDDLAWYL